MNRSLAFATIFIFVTGCVTSYVQEGYTSQVDYQLAQQWGNTRPTQHGLDLLKRNGVTSKAEFDAVVNEMSAANYPQDPNVGAVDSVLYYLRDIQVAQSEQISISNARNKRLAQQTMEKERAKAEEERNKQQFAKEFPYLLVVSCELGGQKYDVTACFTGKHHFYTELEVRNGHEYQMYQFLNLKNAGRMTSEGLAIPLRSQFMIKGRNARNPFLLTFSVYDSINMNLIYKKSAPIFGVIAISS